MGYNKLAILTIFTVLFVVGCAGKSAYMDVRQPVSTDLKKYKNVYLKVTGQRGSNTQEELDLTVAELTKSIQRKLIFSGRYKTVLLHAPEKPLQKELVIRVAIEDFDYLSGASKVLGGIMTGNARLKVRVSLLDAVDNTLVGEMVSGVQGSASSGIFRADTAGQIEEVTKQVVKFVQ